MSSIAANCRPWFSQQEKLRERLHFCGLLELAGSTVPVTKASMTLLAWTHSCCLGATGCLLLKGLWPLDRATQPRLWCRRSSCCGISSGSSNACRIWKFKRFRESCPLLITSLEIIVPQHQNSIESVAGNSGLQSGNGFRSKLRKYTLNA